MKRTELEKIEREVKRVEKRNQLSQKRKEGQNKQSVGEYIESLASLFRYDSEEIFNAEDDVDILELLEGMKEFLPEKKWEDVLRKAIKKTGVKKKDLALEQIKNLLA